MRISVLENTMVCYFMPFSWHDALLFSVATGPALSGRTPGCGTCSYEVPGALLSSALDRRLMLVRASAPFRTAFVTHVR